jgi:diguanylate cyclase (GGDEF)-like protein/PAS domain S-box-containing protein
MAAEGPAQVLLMEDDAGLAHLCQARLKQNGHAVDHALDGEQGLAMYDAGAYDIVLLDHSMPVYDGLEVIRRLASRGRLPPVVMVTGTGDEQTAVEAMRLGARDYVVKDTEGGYLDLLPTVIARVLRHQRAEEYTQLAARVFESVSEGILITDGQGRIVSVNGAFTRITGYSAEEAVGSTPRLLRSGQQEADFYQEMWRSLAETSRWEGELWDRRRNGEAFPVWLTISAVRHAAGAVANYVGVLTDVTHRKQAEERLRHLATHDPLTGLANRALFEDALARALSVARRSRQALAIMLLDLDHFKAVNDALGHAAGDRLLRAVAERLTGSVRDCDVVARLGGDEFVILLAGVTDAQDAAGTGQRVLRALSTPLLIGGEEVAVGASIGISLYPADGEDPEGLLRSADSAMYRAKEGRGRYEFSSHVGLLRR